jgi:hypothetical protein
MTIGDQYMEAARSLAPFNDRFLLTGAAFAKPWEGYLAGEFGDHLISDRTLSMNHPKVHELLLETTAFEDALAEVEITRRADFSDADRTGLREAARPAHRRTNRARRRKRPKLASRN